MKRAVRKTAARDTPSNSPPGVLCDTAGGQPLSPRDRAAIDNYRKSLEATRKEIDKGEPRRTALTPEQIEAEDFKRMSEGKSTVFDTSGREPGSAVPNIKHKLLDWHGAVARVSGGMALTIQRAGIRRADIQIWIKDLRRVADELEPLLGRNGKDT